MHQKEQPPALATPGAGNALAVDRSDSRLELPTSKAKSYWVEGSTEFMYMPDFGGRDELGDIIWLSPPGERWWARIEDRHDGHTLWQRRRRRS
jgi:hypothetical protein